MPSPNNDAVQPAAASKVSIGTRSPRRVAATVGSSILDYIHIISHGVTTRIGFLRMKRKPASNNAIIAVNERY